jgi:2-polyprenyl-3-methyl-5-hydroxy-6-metoxy-1,4-benzoquinol methylase
MNLSVGELVMDSRVTIFSNYVVAKPKFWKEWLRIGEMFFSISESSNLKDKLKDELNRPTTYQGLPRKTFLCEGMAGLVLTLNPTFETYRHDSFGMPYAWSAQLGSYKTEALCCDALKTAIIENPRKQYYEAFRKLSREVLIKAKLISEDTYMHRSEVYDPLDETLLGAIPKNSKFIIEIGCGRGGLANAYRQNNSDINWIGVDPDEDFFHAASMKMDTCLLKNLNSLDQDFIFQYKSVDVWILNNALERMQDPWRFLENLGSVFNTKSCLIINIKNFQHWYFQSQLVSGKLRYDDTSSFCKNQVRLFNRSMLLEMLDAAGFQMNHGVGVRKEHSDPSKYINGIRVMAQAAGVDEQLAVNDAMSDSYVISAKLKQ